MLLLVLTNKSLLNTELLWVMCIIKIGHAVYLWHEELARQCKKPNCNRSGLNKGPNIRTPDSSAQTVQMKHLILQILCWFSCRRLGTHSLNKTLRWLVLMFCSPILHRSPNWRTRPIMSKVRRFSSITAGAI